MVTANYYFDGTTFKYCQMDGSTALIYKTNYVEHYIAFFTNLFIQ